MALILSIDHDGARTTELVATVCRQLRSELVRASSAKEGLDALGARIPDLILITPFIPARDEERILEFLQAMGPAGSHVQRLTTPVRSETDDDPRQFADQVESCLAASAARRMMREAISRAAARTSPDDRSDRPPDLETRVTIPKRNAEAEPAWSLGELYVSTSAEEAWASRTRQPIDALERPAVPGEAPPPVVDFGHIDDLDAVARSFEAAPSVAPPRTNVAAASRPTTPPNKAPVIDTSSPTVDTAAVVTARPLTPDTTSTTPPNLPPDASGAGNAAARLRPTTPPAPRPDVPSAEAVRKQQPITEASTSQPSRVTVAPAEVRNALSQSPSQPAHEPQSETQPEPRSEPVSSPAPSPTPSSAPLTNRGPAMLDDDALSMIGDAAFNALLFGPTTPREPQPTPAAPSTDTDPAAVTPASVRDDRTDASPPPAHTVAPSPPLAAVLPLAATTGRPLPDEPRGNQPDSEPSMADLGKPAEDEWGIFDPDRAGFAALLKLQGGPEAGKPTKVSRKSPRKRS